MLAQHRRRGASVGSHSGLLAPPRGRVGHHWCCALRTPWQQVMFNSAVTRSTEPNCGAGLRQIHRALAPRRTHGARRLLASWAMSISSLISIRVVVRRIFIRNCQSGHARSCSCSGTRISAILAAVRSTHGRRLTSALCCGRYLFQQTADKPARS